MTGELGSCVDPNTGQIMCNAYFQVTNQHPFVGHKDGSVLASPATFENIFAVGDVALVPTHEIKSIVGIVQTAKYCYGNVEAHLFGTPMIPVPERTHELLMMACGKSYGWFIFNAACFAKADASVTKLNYSKKGHN
jgi:NADH dehydrogenase FAD-containing subunit